MISLCEWWQLCQANGTRHTHRPLIVPLGWRVSQCTIVEIILHRLLLLFRSQISQYSVDRRYLEAWWFSRKQKLPLQQDMEIFKESWFLWWNFKFMIKTWIWKQGHSTMIRNHLFEDLVPSVVMCSNRVLKMYCSCYAYLISTRESWSDLPVTSLRGHYWHPHEVTTSKIHSCTTTRILACLLTAHYYWQHSKCNKNLFYDQLCRVSRHSIT